MSEVERKQDKILALKLIPPMTRKVAAEGNKLKDFPEMKEVDHLLAVIQFVYDVLGLEDEASDLLKKPSKITPNIKKRYAQYLLEILQEMKLDEAKIEEIMAGLK